MDHLRGINTVPCRKTKRDSSMVAVVTELSQRLFASILYLIVLHVRKQADPCDCCRSIPLKLTVSHLLKELPGFYGTRIRKVLCSNRCRITVYYERGVSWFSSVSLGNCLDGASIISRPLPSKSSLISHPGTRRVVKQLGRSGQDPPLDVVTHVLPVHAPVCTQRCLLPRKNEAPRCHVTDRGAQ